MLAMPSWIRFVLNVLSWYLGSIKKLYASWKTKSQFLLTYSSHFIINPSVNSGEESTIGSGSGQGHRN